MKTVWQSHGKMSTYIVFLLVYLFLYPRATSAQPPADTSVCEYQETRKNVPINPQTNEPYAPEERNQEPFAGASISNAQIKQCLEATIPITNHHIVFEEYRDAWEELAKETGKYDIPLLITGGVVHANTLYDEKTGRGGIDLWSFGDPTIKDASQLTEEERRTYGITKKDFPIVLIRSEINWLGVSIDSVGSTLQQDIFTIFSSAVNFSDTTFNKTAYFIKNIFNNKSSFRGSSFRKDAYFYNTIFSNETDFEFSTFRNGALFDQAIFYNKVSFYKSSFLNSASFGLVKFLNESSFDHVTFYAASFAPTTFRNKAYFNNSTFGNESEFNGSIFDNELSFIDTIFLNKASFYIAKFNDKTYFDSATFSGETSFDSATFSNKASFDSATFNHVANFSNAIFKDNVNLRSMIVEETLTLDNTIWEGSVDLRRMSTKELHWDSTQKPSEVRGVIDLREATIGRARCNEIRFQDVVDFSRTRFGLYETVVPLPPLFLIHPYEKGLAPPRATVLNRFWMLRRHPAPFTQLANNTFEKEADLIRVTFSGPTLLMNNRFRSTLDLTDTMFKAQNTDTLHAQETQPWLCLSYNRIHRLVLGLEHLGNPPSFLPYNQLMSLFTHPLQTSSVRQVIGPADTPKCGFADTIRDKPKNDKTKPQEENLDAIYKTIGQSFREARDQGGVNEAWYLETVAKREQTATITIWDTIWNWLSWGFGDIPSRYAVDVWRTVWVSIMIMLGFYIIYVWVLRCLVRDHRTLQGPGYAERQRAFRIRLFEPIHRTSTQRTRRIKPLRDAAALSFRAFTKIGLGTAYPNTRGLKFLTTLEWLLGVYMLIHFILAVKNNLPFILPFLGVVN